MRLQGDPVLCAEFNIGNLAHNVKSQHKKFTFFTKNAGFFSTMVESAKAENMVMHKVIHIIHMEKHVDELIYIMGIETNVLVIVMKM